MTNHGVRANNGPKYLTGEDRSDLLAACHDNSLAAAAPVALRAVLDADPGSITLVRFVLRRNGSFRAFRAAADDLGLG